MVSYHEVIHVINVLLFLVIIHLLCKEISKVCVCVYRGVLKGLGSVL